MSEKPQFELARVFDDGSRSVAEIVPVTDLPWDTEMNRRGFLGAGLSAAAVMFILDGEGQAEEFEAWQKTQTAGQAPDTLAVPAEAVFAHTFGVNQLAVSPDGKLVVSGGSDGFFKLWSLASGRLVLRRKVGGEDDSVDSLAIAPDGKMLLTGYGDTTLKAWSLPACAPLGVFRGFGENESLFSLAIAPASRAIITGSDEGVIRVWSWPGRRLLKKLQGGKSSIKSLAVTPDGSLFISGHADNTLCLWSLAEGKVTATMEGHKAEISDLAFSHDGKLLASASNDLRLWSSDGKAVATLKGHSRAVNCLAITGDDRLLISGSDDETINLWSLPDGKLIETLKGHKSLVTSVAVTPDGKTLVSGDSNGVIILWNLDERRFHSYLFDRAANDPDTKAISYTVYDRITGRRITYTLPCGSKIPPGSVCVCNCVRGTYREPVESDSFRICTCNKICTCVPVYRR